MDVKGNALQPKELGSENLKSSFSVSVEIMNGALALKATHSSSEFEVRVKIYSRN
jgi:hypothetical protein